MFNKYEIDVWIDNGKITDFLEYLKTIDDIHNADIIEITDRSKKDARYSIMFESSDSKIDEKLDWLGKWIDGPNWYQIKNFFRYEISEETIIKLDDCELKIILSALGELTGEILDGTAHGFDPDHIKSVAKTIISSNASKLNKTFAEELITDLESL